MKKRLLYLIALTLLSATVVSCTIKADVEEHIKRKAIIEFDFGDFQSDTFHYVHLFLFDSSKTLCRDTVFYASQLQDPSGKIELSYIYDGKYTAVMWSNRYECAFPNWIKGVSKLSEMTITTKEATDGHLAAPYDDLGIYSFDFQIAKGDSLKVAPQFKPLLLGVDVEITGLEYVNDWQSIDLRYTYLNTLDFAGNTVADSTPKTMSLASSANDYLRLRSKEYTSSVGNNVTDDYTLKGTFYTPYIDSQSEFVISLLYPGGKVLYSAQIGQQLSEAVKKGNSDHLKIAIHFTRTTISCTINDWYDEVIDGSFTTLE